MPRYGIRLASTLVATLACCLTPVRALRSIPCSADCNGDDRVAINELILCVNLAVGNAAADPCPACDADGSGLVTIDELILAVNSALGTCHGDVFACCGDGEIQDGEDCDDGNVVGGDLCPADCLYEPGSCPLAAGAYTLTHATGGSMRVASLSPWSLPPGGSLLLDVAAAAPPDCVHGVVVPPEGFIVPPFCIAATSYSVRLMQTGCGAGRIDSNGGADYTVLEVGDTSDSSALCGRPHPGCPPGPPSDATFDRFARVDVLIGDGIPDECASGTANAILAVPVRTMIWLDNGGPGYSCPAEDGTYDPDEGDTLIADFSQILNFTTDASAATWMDLDGDGCALAGIGPAFAGSGACLDLDAKTVTTVAAGVSSATAPLRDITAFLSLPHTLRGPEPPLGVTCATAAAIAFGETTRCLE